MRGGLLFSIVLILLLVLPFSSAATIHGKVYDYGLRLATNSVVQLSTLPPQQLVSADGSYSFEATKGEYVIAALLKDASGNAVYYVEENISVVEDGNYVRDLILFPVTDLSELDIEMDIYDPVSLNGESPSLSRFIYPLLFVAAIVLLFLFLQPLMFRKKEREMPLAFERPIAKDNLLVDDEDDLGKLLAFVRKHKRVTQKDIRKEFPLSEAKISLMITELEHDGKLRKIKKGRGNIIVAVDK